MERSTTPSLSDDEKEQGLKMLIWGLVLLTTILFTSLLFCVTTSHAQQALLWPTPEIDGTVRDLTHLPALPHFPMDPSNLQHQAWSQPGSAMASERHPVILWEEPVSFVTPAMEPTAYPPGARQILVDIIKKFERQSR